MDKEVIVTIRLAVTDEAVLRAASEKARKVLGIDNGEAGESLADLVHWCVCQSWPSVPGTEWQENTAKED